MSARERIIPVFVPHLGCPNDCVFCNQKRISGVQTPADESTVLEAVRRAEELGITGPQTQLAFYGGSFTAIPAAEQTALLGAAKECLESGKIGAIRLSTRPDAIDESVLKRLREYGVRTIELGAQSLCDEVLELSGRGHTAEDVEKASGMIREAGFSLILQMMTGLPGDTRERSLETAERIIAMKPDGVRIYPTVIVKDTALYDLSRSGRYKEHTVEDAVEICAELLPMFEAAGIPVIRLGLNPTDELSSGAAVGGAYHPALGELVRSRILCNRVQKQLEDSAEELRGARVTVGVGPGMISQMVGQHRCNIARLKERFSLAELTVKPCEAKNGETVILSIEKQGL